MVQAGDAVTDATGLAALFAALGEIPARLAALERASEAARADLAAIRATLPPVLFSVPDAARAFKVSLPTMRRWVKAGRVPTVKVGATVRVDMARLHGVDEVTVARLARAAITGEGSHG
jgi:excisionase family DNA binding protein